MTSIPSTNIGLQTPTILDNSLVGNFNTSAIISAEMSVYQQPIYDLQKQQATVNGNIADYQQINSDLAAMQTAASALSMSSGWQQMQATSSDTTVATATAGAGTPAGSISFTVNQMAAAETMVSAGNVASTADVVTSSPDFLLSQGGNQLGFASLASNGLTLGQHTVKVTQASQAAETTGTTSFSGTSSTTITTGSNDTIALTVNGTAYTATLAAGTYNGSQLAAAVNTALKAATDVSTGTTVDISSSVQAGLSGGTSGDMVLATTSQGSSQTLQLTGGTALASLGMSTMSSAATGVDGIMSVDGTSTTLSTVTAGATATLAAPTGSVTATLGSLPSTVGGSLLQVGSLTATDVSTGNGSLADVVANVNAAHTGVTASAVATGTNQYVLQLASSSTGVANDLSVDPSAFSSSTLGAMQVATAGTDAQITVGGTSGYKLSSSTDTFSGLLPGLSVTALKTSSTAVAVTVGADATAIANDVQNLVSSANTVLADVKKYAGYNAATKTGGPLMGSAVLQDLTNQVQNVFASVTGTSTLGNGKSVGITLNSDGTISFDQKAFTQAFQNDAAGVQAMFTQGGTFAAKQTAYTGQVGLSYAQTATRSGSYDVTVSQSAAQAVSKGSTLASGTVTTPETLTIAMGSASVNYTTTTGESLSSVASGINSALAQAGLAMSATVVGGTQLQLASSAYGSSASFSVTTTATGSGTTGLAGTGAVAGTPTTFTGTNVAGTIDGAAATGSGQFLTVPSSSTSGAAGLSLQVTASGITSSTDLGSFTYTPGIAQSLASVADALSNPSSGAIGNVISNLQTQVQGMSTQITFYANIAAEEQKTLTNQYAALQTTLGKLQNQGSSLASALAGLSTI